MRRGTTCVVDYWALGVRLLKVSTQNSSLSFILIWPHNREDDKQNATDMRHLFW